MMISSEYRHLSAARIALEPICLWVHHFCNKDVLKSLKPEDRKEYLINTLLKRGSASTHNSTTTRNTTKFLGFLKNNALNTTCCCTPTRNAYLHKHSVSRPCRSSLFLFFRKYVVFHLPFFVRSKNPILKSLRYYRIDRIPGAVYAAE